MTVVRTRTRAPVVVFVLGGVVLATLISSFMWGSTFVVEDVVVFGLAMTYFLSLGALILSRVPGNRIGWLFAAISLSIGLSGLLEPFGALGFTVAYTIAGALWLFWIGLAPLLLLWFPDGQAPSPRWRVAEWFLFVMIGGMTLSALFTERLCQNGEGGRCLEWIDNPIGIPGVPHPEYTGVLGLLLVVGLVASVAAVVWRYRNSGTAERLQLKWFLLATSLFIVSIVAEIVYEVTGKEAPPWVSLLSGVAILSIPVAATVAILRYRLYEIDRIISRTVSYALVIGLLAAAVALVATAAGSQFQEPVVVAATTLGVAAVFNPLRRRIQDWVDRRFNRSRFDAERVLAEFAGSLRDQVDPDQVVEGWTRVVDETMQPASSGVWVKR